MSIQPLPGDVVAHIKSSAAITSLNSAVKGLLQNSLDAGASKITLSVDYSRGNCSVEDNGEGIAPSSFQEDGGLGRLHCTSRFPPRPECHGRRGEFLACLGSLSLLSITSHHREYRTHNSLTIHNSRVAARNLPAPPEQRVLASASGTRVIVRDLFGSMPVRVKQRAAEVERAGTSREFGQLISDITALLLPWPGEVTVAVQDTYARQTVVLRAPRAADWGRDRDSTALDMISRTRTILRQAALLDDGDFESWERIGATAPGISVKGCVSLRPVATKNVQFIALGIQPLPNERGSNFLYEEVNRVFEDSSFGRTEGAGLDEHALPVKTEGVAGKELRSRRGVDRWPMFFIQIHLDTVTHSGGLQGFFEESNGRELTAITDLLQVIAYEFLKKHGFRPKLVNAVERLKRPRADSPIAPSRSPKALSAAPSRADSFKLGTHRPGGRREGRTQTALPSSRSRSSEGRPASPFASWYRVKSNTSTTSGSKDSTQLRGSLGSASDTFERLPKPSMGTPDTSSGADNPLYGKSGILLRKPFGDADDASPSQSPAMTDTQPSPADMDYAKNTVVWVDPANKIRTVIDARTGFAVNSRQPRSTSSARDRFAPRQNDRQKTAFVGEHRRIFRPTEVPIPQVAQPLDTVGCQELVEPAIEASTESISATLEGRISKAALRQAEVLGQVDRKFILARASAAAPADSAGDATRAQEDMLLLIDQHAADERCQVETLLKTYFVPDPAKPGRLLAQTQSLDKPLRLELPRQDGELLMRFRRHFAHWGITYEVTYCQQATALMAATVEVQTLPPSIAERCRLEPRLLIELLRRQIWKLHGAEGGTNPLEVGTEKDWVARFHACPDGVLDVINSRACRSAIMFNDPLTLEQCSDLVRRLAACAFPFQCAHGRPSMVPLVHLGHGSAPGERDLLVGDERPGSLLKALKSWRRGMLDRR